MHKPQAPTSLPAVQPDPGVSKGDHTVRRVTPKRSTRPLNLGGGTGKTVYIIDIKGEIEQGIAPFLERVIKRAERDGARALVLHIDTPGGRVDAMDKMRKALLRAKLTTIAFVDKEAISAGAVIAYACDIIIFSNGASMGAATPVQISSGKAKAVSEKYVSWMRGLIRATAVAKKRNGDIAEAMVDADIDLRPLAPAKKLLTITTTQALAYGVADGQAESLDELFAKLNLTGATRKRLKMTWGERVAGFLTSSVVSSLLMTLGGLGLLIGLYTGSALALIVGVCCLAIFMLGHIVADMVGYEELLLFAIGAILLILELTVIPGFGVVGVLGILFIFGGLLLSLSGLDFSTQWETREIGSSMLRVSISLTVLVIAAILLVRYGPESKLGRHLILSSALTRGDGRSPAANGGRDAGSLSQFLNKRGVTLTDLRPSGKALIDNRKVEVISDGGFIPKGSAVVVIEVSLSRVAVRRVDA